MLRAAAGGLGLCGWFPLPSESTSALGEAMSSHHQPNGQESTHRYGIVSGHCYLRHFAGARICVEFRKKRSSVRLMKGRGGEFSCRTLAESEVPNFAGRLRPRGTSDVRESRRVGPSGALGWLREPCMRGGYVAAGEASCLELRQEQDLYWSRLKRQEEDNDEKMTDLHR